MINKYAIPRKHHFSIKKYQIRKITKKSTAEFINAFKAINWEPIYEIVGAHEKNEFFQSKIELLVDRFFPVKTFSAKSTDNPWITEWIKKKIKRRNREYRLHGKSDKWYALDQEITADMKVLKRDYFSKECKKLTTRGAHRIPFNALKNLKTPNRAEPWSILDLYSDKLSLIHI